ncbi:MAG: hypothetical protein KY469_06030 [Actinobacteria bacterium]|nr:hypothetical protein [Actinomycetota bacterium]
MATARRAMRRHQGLPPDRKRPLWRLVLGEFAYMLGQLVRPRLLVPALVAAGVVTLGLSPATPGPVLDPLPLAALAAATGAAAVYISLRMASRGRTPDRGDSSVLQQAAGGIGMVALMAGVFALAAWVLAVVLRSLF